MDDVSTHSSGFSEQIERARFKEYRLITLNGDFTWLFIFVACLISIHNVAIDLTELALQYILYIRSKLDSENDNVFVTLRKVEKNAKDPLIQQFCTHLKNNQYLYFQNTILLIIFVNCLYERLG